MAYHVVEGYITADFIVWMAEGYITVDFIVWMVEGYITVDPLIDVFCLGSSVTRGYQGSIHCCLLIFEGQHLHMVCNFRPHHRSLEECNHHYKCSTNETESRAIKWCFIG